MADYLDVEDEASYYYQGDPVTPPCPKCGGPCVYNGNYFCLDREYCKWALTPVEYDRKGNEIERPAGEDLWFVIAYGSLMAYRERKGEPLATRPRAKREPVHGKRSTYSAGCRCALCTAENTRAHREYTARVRDRRRS
jgi:hypothetical protein